MTLVDPETGEVVRLDVYEARFTGLIHPAADRYPRMKEQQLGEMALDIVDNGQREPIWVDADGTLLDGRNRLSACQMVGVEPHFAMYTGEDVEKFIVSKNEHRRHLSTKEQRELRQRRIAELREKGMSTRAIAEDLGVAKSTVDAEISHVADDRPRDMVPVRGVDDKVYGAWSDEKSREFLAAYDAAERGGKALIAQGYGLTVGQAANRADRLRKKFGKPAVLTKSEKVARIVELAPTGMTMKQIAAEVDLSEKVVGKYAAEAGVTIHAQQVIGRTHRLKADRVIGGIVQRVAYDIENDSALAAINVADADPTLIEGWVSSLSESIRSLTTLKKQLTKELTRG